MEENNGKDFKGRCIEGCMKEECGCFKEYCITLYPKTIRSVNISDYMFIDPPKLQPIIAIPKNDNLSNIMIDPTRIANRYLLTQLIDVYGIENVEKNLKNKQNITTHNNTSTKEPPLKKRKK